MIVRILSAAAIHLFAYCCSFSSQAQPALNAPELKIAGEWREDEDGWWAEDGDTLLWSRHNPQQESEKSTIHRGVDRSPRQLDEHINNATRSYSRENYENRAGFHKRQRDRLARTDPNVGNLPSNSSSDFGYSIDQRYLGPWKNGLYDGVGGLYKYEDGSTYFGDWVEGRRSGLGEFTNPNTQYSYLGDWYYGRPTGIGQIKFPGYFYFGEVDNGIPKGFGFTREEDNFEYVGAGVSINNGTYIGTFRSLNPNSKIQYTSGEFRGGKLHGYGSVKLRSGEQFIGEFKQGEPVGKTLQVEPNDLIRLGRLENNQKSGKYVSISSAGTIEQSRWERGEFVQVVYSDVPDTARQIEEISYVIRNLGLNVFESSEKRFLIHNSLEIADPVFVTVDQIKFSRALFISLTDLSVYKSRELTKEANVAGSLLLREAINLLMFIDGLGRLSDIGYETLQKLDKKFQHSVRGILEAASDPVEAAEKIIENTQLIFTEDYANTLSNFFEQKFEQFRAANSYEKGRLARDLITEITSTAGVIGLEAIIAGPVLEGTTLYRNIHRVAWEHSTKSGRELSKIISRTSKTVPWHDGERTLLEIVAEGRFVRAGNIEKLLSSNKEELLRFYPNSMVDELGNLVQEELLDSLNSKNIFNPYALLDVDNRKVIKLSGVIKDKKLIDKLSKIAPIEEWQKVVSKKRFESKNFSYQIHYFYHPNLDIVRDMKISNVSVKSN